MVIKQLLIAVLSNLHKPGRGVGKIVNLLEKYSQRVHINHRVYDPHREERKVPVKSACNEVLRAAPQRI